MLHINNQPIDLNVDPRAAIGQPVVQRREESIGALAAVAVTLSLGAALIAIGGLISLQHTLIVGVAGLGVAAFTAYLAWGFIQDAMARQARIRRQLTVTYGLTEVRVRSADAPEQVLSFDEAWSHPLGERAPRRLKGLIAARAALIGEGPDSPRRVALELAGLHRDDFPEARKVYIGWRPDGLAIFAGEEGARDFRRADLEVWAVACAKDGPHGGWRPKLEKRWAMRYNIP